MAKTRYYIPQFFQEEFNKLIKSGADFEYVRTSYTKKLKTKQYTILFNPEGKADDRVLSLINHVRNDAKDYLLENGNKLKDGKIFFLDLFEIPDEKEIICKVDLTSAYWKRAMLDGIIKEETNELLKDYFCNNEDREKNLTQQQLKGIRLKSLGSLATRKEYEFFEGGKSVHWESQQQPTKKLYMNICRSIDGMMRECRQKVDGCVFYYWDCMFVRKEFASDVIEFFKKQEFDCKLEETKLQYDKIGNKGYFTSTVDGKMYLVSSENRHLLPKRPMPIIEE